MVHLSVCVFNAKIQTVDTGKARGENLEQKWRRKTLETFLTADLSALGLSSLLRGCRVLGTGAGEGGHRLLLGPQNHVWSGGVCVSRDCGWRRKVLHLEILDQVAVDGIYWDPGA